MQEHLKCTVNEKSVVTYPKYEKDMGNNRRIVFSTIPSLHSFNAVESYSGPLVWCYLISILMCVVNDPRLWIQVCLVAKD